MSLLNLLTKFQAQISSLYFHQESQMTFIGTFEKGVFAYDIRQQRIIHSNTDLSDVNIARIKPLNQTELLIATEGMGIHKIQHELVYLGTVHRLQLQKPQ